MSLAAENLVQLTCVKIVTSLYFIGEKFFSGKPSRLTISTFGRVESCAKFFSLVLKGSCFILKTENYLPNLFYIKIYVVPMIVRLFKYCCR